MAYAIDWINGETLCECAGGSGQFLNLATGEVQCQVICEEEPLCAKTWSPQDGQFNIICDLVG